MDGMLIGLVRDALIRQYGEEIWDALAGRTPTADGAPSDSLACWLGQRTVPALRDTYPTLFSRHDDLASFVLGLGDELPVAGRRRPSSVPMSFRSVESPDGEILLRIEADCSMCALIQGVIAGAAVHYGEPVSIHQIKSRRRGDNVCLLRVAVGETETSVESDLLELAVVGNA
jgi:hypothetical protein